MTTPHTHVRLVGAGGVGYDVPLGGVEVYVALNNVSVSPSGAVNGPSSDTSKVKRVRPFILSSGADITVRLQVSFDGGTTWANAASYALAATGAQAVFEIPGPLVRLRAENANAIGAQSVDARIVAEKV